MHEIREYRTTLGGREVVVETGRLAWQAGGAVTVRMGDGMVLVASILTQGVKMLFLKNAEVGKIRIAAAVVALLVVIIAKLISSNPFEIADIVVLPGNALIVWFSSMKGYEQVVGLPGTPAGNTDIKNVH